MKIKIIPYLLFIIGFVLPVASKAQDARQLLREVNKKFVMLNSYHADVLMNFNIPSVKMKSLKGKVFYKKPNKFRVKANGIFFLPKQNPLQSLSTILLDTSAYTAVASGYEMVSGKNCAVINLIPTKSNNDIVLAKFWIEEKNPLVLKSQVTTKNNGTIETENSYGKQARYALPDRMLITVEVAKMKVPKMLAVDLNKKSKEKTDMNVKEKGTIELMMSNYKLNENLSDAVFLEENK
jgi:outer membrane lipoprotein-sorting protein